MQAHQFGGGSGSGPGPEPGDCGDARTQASIAITGRESYHTHERVCALMDWAQRKATPPEIRAMATDALKRIEDGDAVKPLYLKVKEAYDESQAPHVETNLERLAREALERVRKAREEQRKLKRSQGSATHYRSVRSFNLIWNELDGLSEMYDVDALAAEMTAADWDRFDRVVTAAVAFRDQLSAARRNLATPA